MCAFEQAGGSHRFRLAVLGAALLMPLVLSGCASNSNPNTRGTSLLSWRLFEEPRRLAVGTAAKLDLEDDGVPAQSPPSYHVRQTADDPTQPWSRNYGRSAEQIPETVSAAAIDASAFDRNILVKPISQRIASQAAE